MHFALLVVFLAAAPKDGKCRDRACLTAAADQGRAIKGELDTADWFGFGMPVKGRTEITIDVPAPGKCVAMLKLKVEEAPASDGLTKKQVAERMNADTRSEMKCTAACPAISKLIAKIGKASPLDFDACRPTNCDPLPPLASGCTAAGCVDGSYAVTCSGADGGSCLMTGVATEALSPGCTYACRGSAIGFTCK